MRDAARFACWRGARDARIRDERPGCPSALMRSAAFAKAIQTMRTAQSRKRFQALKFLGNFPVPGAFHHLTLPGPSAITRLHLDRGRSSGVEHNLAKVRVGRSIRLARSRFSQTCMVEFPSVYGWYRDVLGKQENVRQRLHPEHVASHIGNFRPFSKAASANSFCLASISVEICAVGPKWRSRACPDPAC